MALHSFSLLRLAPLIIWSILQVNLSICKPLAFALSLLATARNSSAIDLRHSSLATSNLRGCYLSKTWQELDLGWQNSQSPVRVQQQVGNALQRQQRSDYRSTCQWVVYNQGKQFASNCNACKRWEQSRQPPHRLAPPIRLFEREMCDRFVKERAYWWTWRMSMHFNFNVEPVSKGKENVYQHPQTT